MKTPELFVVFCFSREEKMKIRLMLTAVLLGFFFANPPSASAHFGMVIPSDSMVMQGEARDIALTLSFSHPFEMVGMDMGKPESFQVYYNGKGKDLTPTLEKTSVMGRTAWKTRYSISRPGAYVFAMTPQPYWEPAEDLFIIHYTKTVVAAFGLDEGWDKEIGLKTEIVPLSKPYGLYAANVFQGIVKMDGKAVPHAQVEVEYYNEGKTVKAPTDYMIAQTIKADENGIFTYAAPAPGWWGFAALNTADYTLKKDGEPKEVELGAVIWVKFHPWNEK